jgi:hypothetical protein
MIENVNIVSLGGSDEFYYEFNSSSKKEIDRVFTYNRHCKLAWAVH